MQTWLPGCAQGQLENYLGKDFWKPGGSLQPAISSPTPSLLPSLQRVFSLSSGGLCGEAGRRDSGSAPQHDEQAGPKMKLAVLGAWRKHSPAPLRQSTAVKEVEIAPRLPGRL